MVSQVDEPFAQMDPNLENLVSHFSGKGRRGVLNQQDKSLSTEEWFNRAGEKTGPRIAPKDWGFEGARAPLIHEVRFTSMKSIYHKGLL